MGEERHSKRHPVRVFISYSDQDSALARQVRNLLVHRVHARVFTAEDLSAGEKWQTKLRNELSSADVVVAILTPRSTSSSWMLQELGAAWALRKPIISVVSKRDLLNDMPISLERDLSIELADIQTPENADKFVDAFEESLAASHLS